MKGILILFWVFFFPIANFIWDLFHQHSLIYQEIEKKDLRYLKKSFFSLVLGVPFLFLSAKNLEKNILFFVFFEVIIFDYVSASCLFHWLKPLISNKIFPGFNWFKKNWFWYRTCAPIYTPIIYPIYIIFTFFLISDLSSNQMILIIFLYPVISYYQAKTALFYLVNMNKLKQRGKTK